MEEEPLLQMLRFVGVPAENASHVAALQQRSGYRLVAPSFGTASNPIEPRLAAELEAYFRPFTAQLRKMVGSHKKCFADAQARKRRKQDGVRAAALARAG